MSSEAVSLAQTSPQQRQGQLKLIAVFAVAGLPVLLAMVMYFGGIGIPSNSSNKGNLLWPPLALESLLAEQTAAAMPDHAQAVLGTKWRLLLTGTEPCTKQCEALIHTARQVHMSTGRELERVTRVFLALPEHGLPSHLSERYPAMLRAQGSKPALLQHQASARAQGYEVAPKAWTLWLVDPLGNVILHYGHEHDGYDVLADLKKLLKLSKIG